MGGFKNWMHIWNLETAKRLHKPVFYWGRSIGPFNECDNDSKVFKRNSINLLKYFSYISLRDGVSIKYAEELGVKAEAVVDSAFLECPDALIPENILQTIGGNDYVVYVPNELTWHPRYPKSVQSEIDSFFLKIIDLITDKYPDIKIVMLPQTYNSEINDYSYFLRLKEAAKNKNIIVVDEGQNSDIQQKIISGSKMVIGARYHSIVFAINNNVPFISLSYEHKMKGLLETLSLKEYMVEIQDIFGEGNEMKYNSAIEKVSKLLSLNPSSVSNTEARKIVTEKFEEMIKLMK
jgi:colanic acid/amylovoran biosynthesis protein